jgi:hypothetical protein
VEQLAGEATCIHRMLRTLPRAAYRVTVPISNGDERQCTAVGEECVRGLSICALRRAPQRLAGWCAGVEQLGALITLGEPTNTGKSALRLGGAMRGALQNKPSAAINRGKPGTKAQRIESEAVSACTVVPVGTDSLSPAQQYSSTVYRVCVCVCVCCWAGGR